MFDVLAGALTGGLMLGGAVAQNSASENAAKMQQDAVNRATALQERMYNEGVQRNQPFYNTGVDANNRLASYLGLIPGDPSTFSKYATAEYKPFVFQEDPGYGFRLKEGMKALDRSAAARGGLQSGNALKAALGYGQSMASDEYSKAFDRYNMGFNRFQIERENTLNPLMQMSGYGQSNANQLNALGSQFGANMGDLYTGLGNSQAANAINRGNIWSNFTNRLGSMITSQYSR